MERLEKELQSSPCTIIPGSRQIASGLAVRPRACWLVILGLVIGVFCGPATAADFEQRWIRINANFVLAGEADRVIELVERAAEVGYNGVYISDGKVNHWWAASFAESWLAELSRVQDRADELGMRFMPGIIPQGYCGSMLYHDQNLISGYPIVDAPLVAVDGVLVSEETAAVENGDFETFVGDDFTGWFQDDPGIGSFVDFDVVKEGESSIRFEDVGEVNEFGHGRVIQDFEVEPFRQYRIRFWVKTEDLSTGSLQMLIRDGEGVDRLGDQDFSLVLENGGRGYFRKVEDYTLDWTEMSMTFNSVEQTTAKIILGVWGGGTGKLWLDDIRIDEVPTLNVVRRATLPLALRTEAGVDLVEGVDFSAVEDPLLGQIPFVGSYETYHEPPTISLPDGSSIAEGDRVFLSAYHGLVTQRGQVSCSWYDPALWPIVEDVFLNAETRFAPDGYMVSADEVRTGGWEPGQTSRAESSGQVLARNFERIARVRDELAPGRPIYAWSDMFDPGHNAVAEYYHVNNTIEGSWEGLRPETTIFTWWGTSKIAEKGRPSLEFFAGRGHRQILSGYYDSDVVENYDLWIEAAEGIPGVVGTMYTTWTENYDDLELFAETWWGGADGLRR